MSTVLRLLAEAPAEIRLRRAARRWSLRRAGLIEEAPRYAPPEFGYPDQEPINLDDFEYLTGKELAKLEVYCFANCANTMPYIGAWERAGAVDRELWQRARRRRPARHAGAARGLLGDRYSRDHTQHQGAWGHMLNEHYLPRYRTLPEGGTSAG